MAVGSPRIEVIFSKTLVAALFLFNISVLAQTNHPKPQPKCIELHMSDTTYQEILGGAPETVSMQSGLVVLAPNKSVGKHNTKNHEEAVIVFSGTGELRIPDGQTLKLVPNTVAYCPPFTEHDVFNTGSTFLRYLYVACRPK